MTVLKRKRKASQFEVFHHLYEMRRDLTNLLLMDFGLSPAKEQRVLQKVLNGRDFDQLPDWASDSKDQSQGHDQDAQKDEETGPHPGAKRLPRLVSKLV